MTRTRRVTRTGWGRGTTTARWSVSANTRAISSMLSASSRKSSSSTIVSAKSSTRAGGLASVATGMRPMRWGASQLMAAMSRVTRRLTCGRWTFTTTSSPLRSRAACTWAIEAAAIGAVPKCSNTSPMGRPRSASTTLRTISNGSGGTWSRSSRNSPTSSGGNTPSPEERIWPSLMYVGPRRSNALRSRRERPARDISRRPNRSALRLSTRRQVRMARPRVSVVTRTRRPGGSRRLRSNFGTRSPVSARSCSFPVRQGRGLPVRSHGAASLNAPMARSAGLPGNIEGLWGIGPTGPPVLEAGGPGGNACSAALMS